MRHLVVAVVAMLLAATPAAAQSPAPTLISFDTADLPGRYTSALVARDPGCDGNIFMSSTLPHSAPRFLFAPCRPTLRLAFPAPQASVQLFARITDGPATTLVATAHTVTGPPVTVTIPDPSVWRPVVLAAPGIDYVDLRAEGADLGVDDLAFSASPQPDSVVTAGPAARVDEDRATFAFGANRPDIAGWQCSLDGAAFTACASPLTLTGLGPGPHTFRAAAIDSYGAVDASPAQHVWTVLGPPPDTPAPPGAAPVVNGGTVTLDIGTPGGGVAGFECSVDGAAFAGCSAPFTVSGLAPGPHTIDVRAVDADGRADPTPRRFAFDVPQQRSGLGGGASETDLDHDRIADSREILPLGNVPPVAGVRTLARLLSGTVYVKLPSNGSSLAQAGPLAGFVSLKGIAALPVGTIVDARRGSLSLQSAGDGRAVGDPRRRLGTATLAQAIFRIRQQRLRRAALRARAIPTTLVLASAPEAERGCRALRPSKGIVRSLTARAKGLFRVSGGASRAQGNNAAWRTTDYCSGTVTRVTRGRVSVYDKARRRTVTVRAGHYYRARARLFQARKGRRPS